LEKDRGTYLLNPFNNYKETTTEMKDREKLMWYSSKDPYDDVKEQEYFVTAYQKLGMLDLEKLLEDKRVVLKMDDDGICVPFTYTRPERGII
jgi:hypothetical protein